MNKRQAKKAMNKAQNRPIQTQNEGSKRIKRINTNIKAIGVKYGKNSIQYRTAIDRLSDTLNVRDITITKSGYVAIRNTNRTQLPAIQARLKELEKADEMSISNLNKASKAQLKSRGYNNPSKSLIEENTKYVAGLDYVIRNTDKWYEFASAGNEELQRVKDILKDHRQKDYSELQDVVETVMEEIDKENERYQQEAYDAHSDEGLILRDINFRI